MPVSASGVMLGAFCPSGPCGIAGKGVVALEPAQEIARRVAFLAMRHRLGEIAAAVPFRALARDRLQRPGVKNSMRQTSSSGRKPNGKLHLRAACPAAPPASAS